MVANATREEVQRLVAEGWQLIEVLPREEYDELHIAGALAVRAGDWPLAVVVNDARIVLGRLRARDVERHSSRRANEVMLDGPRTVRGHGRSPNSRHGWMNARSRACSLRLPTASLSGTCAERTCSRLRAV